MVVPISVDLPRLASRLELVADIYKTMDFMAIFSTLVTIYKNNPFPDSRDASSLDHMVVELSTSEPWSRPGLH